MVKPSVARDVTEATADAWVSEPALGEEQSRWSASASTWRSWNRMSPEHEFCEFVAAVVRLVKPEIVIETGVGQGFTTRRVAAALAPGSVLKGFESDDAWRERLARLSFFHGPTRLLAEEPTPTDDDLASVDLLVADSVFDFRFDEVRRWAALAQQGSYIVVHDIGNGHPAWTPHQRLGELITSLGINGVRLPNPRGSFLGQKSGPPG